MIEKLKLPKRNLDLMQWAKDNGFPRPRPQEFYPQYRKRLELEKRAG